MSTRTRSGRSARTNAIVTVGSVIGILVLLNVLGVFVFGRADLTVNQRYTLSGVSKAAVEIVAPILICVGHFHPSVAAIL